MKYKVSYNDTTEEFDSVDLTTAIKYAEKLTFNKPYEIFVKAGPYNESWIFIYGKGLKKTNSREKHIAEFWKSFYSAIQLAGGSINSFGPQTTMLEVAEILAQNGIRFHYEKNSIS